MRSGKVVILMLFLLLVAWGEAELFTAKLIHRFSEEAMAAEAARVSRCRKQLNADDWPQKGSTLYYRKLLGSDSQRVKRMMMAVSKMDNHYQYLFPYRGSSVLPSGNDFGWLHYTWIDIGTPNVSFLVALDTGSDLLWIPCNCMQCAPLSASSYSTLDKDLNEYNPSGSTTKKDVPCSHELCKLGSNCKSPEQPCAYTVNYDTADTSTSGLLVEDILHLASSSADESYKSVRAPVIVGCGSKQSGSYLSGVAPDGLMGLGPGEISVPSFLAKAGLSRNSFSLCFNEDHSGRMFFGDQGVAGQHTTPFLSSDIGSITYVIGAEACCVRSFCLEQTNFKALVDSGTSFTYLPYNIYQKVAEEFDRQVNMAKSSFEGYDWQYCYKSSSQELPEIPSLSLKFAQNDSFEVINPILVIYGSQGVIGFCLAISHTDDNIGIIGQNFMTGYRVVFDRENMKLGWSRSQCEDLTDGQRMPLTPFGSFSNPLPTTGQQSKPNGHSVAPAVTGRTPSNSMAKSAYMITRQFNLLDLPLFLLLVAAYVVIQTF